MSIVILALMLTQFTGPTGRRIDVNEEQITSIRDPASMPEGHYGKGTHCVIIMSNGRGIAVAETCADVRTQLHGVLPSRGACALVCGESPKR